MRNHNRKLPWPVPAGHWLFSLFAISLLISACGSSGSFSFVPPPHPRAAAASRPHDLGAANNPWTGIESFQDVTTEAGIAAAHEGSWNEYGGGDFNDGYMGVGQAWGDYDRDGWVDLYVTGNLLPNSLYHNNGDGTFTLSPLTQQVALPDVTSGGAVWADYDNDGWKDLYVLAHGANVLFRNDNGQAFVNVTAMAGVGDLGKSSSASWADYNSDGFLDLYVTNWACYPACDPLDNEQAQDRLFHNNGNGTFSDVSHLLLHQKLLGAGFISGFADFDNDGDPDLYVVNDKLKNPIGNVLFRNDGPGCDGWCWTDISTASGADVVLHGMGLAVGDYDNDLDLDFFFTNMVEASALLSNQGDGTFTKQTEVAGLPVVPSDQVGWGTGFFDYDNDSWLDIFIATTAFVVLSPMEGPLGMLLEYPNSLYRNNGDGTFAPVSPASWAETPTPSMGFAYADYNHDGFVDFVTSDWDVGTRLYRNAAAVGQDNRWVGFRLIGGGPVNRDAIGTRVYLDLSDGRTLMQEVKAGSSLGAGNDTALHFGLGDAFLRTVRIMWPDGETSHYNRPDVNRLWTIEYFSATGADLFQDVTTAAGIDAAHKASWRMFKPDWESGYLGVGQAWGDFNNDGWLDLYMTGNLGPSSLYVNNGDGSFAASKFSPQVALPDVKSGGAVWADYDNDGWKDLYVLAHGANVLFHNDEGKGFRDVTAMAGVGDGAKGSTATWGDYDNDGFLDLYLANWSCVPECDPIDLTLAEDRLYHNNGDGTFSDVTALLTPVEKLQGAGFTASFVDFDNDGDMDIYVVNDALMNPVGNVLWRNDGPGCQVEEHAWCWTDASAESGSGLVIEGMGLAVGDYDNDLDLDMYFTNMVNPSALLTNRGDGSFVENAVEMGVEVGPSAAVGWGNVFFDFDNDSWLDLFIATTEFRNLDRDTPPDGMHFPHANLLYRNLQGARFLEVSPRRWTQHPTRSMGVAYADFDRDGFVDFVTGDFNDRYRLFHNSGLLGQDNHWLAVELRGRAAVNRDAVGARVYVTTDRGRVLFQEVKNGSSLGAGNTLALHFGLGVETVAAVQVIWPDGTQQTFEDVAVDQYWRLTYP